MNTKQVKDIITRDIYEYLRTDTEDGLKLPLRQIKFVAEYIVNGYNGFQAYWKQVKKSTGSKKTAEVESCRLLKNPKIQRAIALLTRNWLDQKKEEFEKKIIAIWTQRAFYDPTELVDDKGEFKFGSIDEVPSHLRCVIDGVETRAYGKNADVQKTIVKLANRENALRELSKYTNIMTESMKHIHTGGDGSGPIEITTQIHNMSDDELAKLAGKKSQ